jgi:hypothetical protein
VSDIVIIIPYLFPGSRLLRSGLMKARGPSPSSFANGTTTSLEVVMPIRQSELVVLGSALTTGSDYCDAGQSLNCRRFCNCWTRISVTNALGQKDREQSGQCEHGEAEITCHRV